MNINFNDNKRGQYKPMCHTDPPYIYIWNIFLDRSLLNMNETLHLEGVGPTIL